jgi:AcrR family transcriptional regulator
VPKVVPEYKAQARARIVEAAQAVFHRKGFRSATMDDIAKEVGVSKGAIYLYFRTKTDLLAQIQAAGREEFAGRWRSLLNEGDIAEGFARSLDDVFSGKSDPSIFHELVAESASDPEVRKVLVQDQKEDERLLQDFLVQLEERGRIPKMSDPETVAQIVIRLLEGTVLEMMLRGPSTVARRHLVRQLRFVLGLAPRKVATRR